MVSRNALQMAVLSAFGVLKYCGSKASPTIIRAAGLNGFGETEDLPAKDDLSARAEALAADNESPTIHVDASSGLAFLWYTA